MRNIKFAKGEYYHIYNRGVDKRSIFEDKEDVLRFLRCMKEFNTIEPTGGLYVNSFSKSKLRGSASKLVSFITYCLNQNHYNFIIQPLVEDGIQKFMHKLSTGYTMYFNEKYDRSGSLFQGKYKATHITSNEYLLHVSVYTNLNDRVHGELNKQWLAELPFSSFKEYQNLSIKGLCDTSVILDQFSSPQEYCRYASTVLEEIIKRKAQEKSLQKMIID
jgi:putative transposase